MAIAHIGKNAQIARIKNIVRVNAVAGEGRRGFDAQVLRKTHQAAVNGATYQYVA